MVKRLFLIVTIFLMSVKPLYSSYEFIPSQTEILSVQWKSGQLVIDVSKDMTSYGGGNAMEYEIQREILGAVFSIPEVESFTLLIEGQEDGLPEGTRISNYTRERYNANNYFCNTKSR